MKLRTAWVLILLVGVVFGIGCDDEESPEPPDLGSYAPPTTPENLINNLQVSYRQREIEEYAKILAPEFRFKFQPVDQGTIGQEYWSRTEDSTGTRALLTTPEVAEIRIDLLNSDRDSTIDESPPADSVRIRIHTTDLQVNQTNDITWVVSDEQDMFFRLGRPENGENPTHWFLYEWHDLPSFSSPRLRTEPPTSVTLPTTWGKIKSQFSN